MRGKERQNGNYIYYRTFSSSSSDKQVSSMEKKTAMELEKEGSKIWWVEQILIFLSLVLFVGVPYVLWELTPLVSFGFWTCTIFLYTRWMDVERGFTR